jgi:hypothetical protein
MGSETIVKVDHRSKAEIEDMKDILLIYVPFLCVCGFEHTGIGRFSTRGWKCPNCGFSEPEFSFLQHLIDNTEKETN